MELRLMNLNKKFGANQVLNDVSMTVKSGAIFGYLGQNGAGKTTTIRILMNVFAADGGTILLDGAPFDPLKQSIGYLPEERGLYSKSLVIDQLIYFARLRGASKLQAQETVHYWTKRFNIEMYLKRKLETLSKGNQQKVQITQAFLNDPAILILDEPFSGLDPVNSQVFQEALLEYVRNDKIVIFSSHQMAYVESFCDDIAIINHGEIVLEGSLDQIKSDMGHGVVRVRANNLDALALQSLLTRHAFTVQAAKEDVLIQLGDNHSKKSIADCLFANGVDIHDFCDYRPSLQEIFIRKVGEPRE